MRRARASAELSAAAAPSVRHHGRDIRTEPAVGALHLASDVVLRDFPGASLVVDREGHVLGESKAAAPLAASLRGASNAYLVELIDKTLTAGPRNEFVTADSGEIFDLALFPIPGDEVLMIGRESTLERNLQNALVDSRRRYKDIVECSSDFAWETGADGAFVFVSPRGALGHEAVDLVGREARDLLHERHAEPSHLPFDSRVPMEGITVWLRAADGTAACVETSCLPLFDPAGNWIGARGVCRDVTEARARDEALARARHRERLVSRLVNTIREELNPDMLLGRAAEATGQALDADHCLIFRTDSGDEYALAAAFGETLGDDPVCSLAGRLAHRQGIPDPWQFSVNGLKVLAAPTRHHRGVNGAICVIRGDGGPDWDEEGRALLTAVAQHLGIAIAQIVNHETLKQLSRTDELTGLLNRRAFNEELQRRHGLAIRKQSVGSILYIDLDNFKLVNDVHGHQTGDEVLKAWAAALIENTRVSDVIARLGGDEFAIWLEETNQDGAITKAANLLDAGAGLKPYSGDPGQPLCVSIGIAVFDPATGESLGGLIARADAAMYSTKYNGKGAYSLAPASAEDAGAGQGEGESP